MSVKAVSEYFKAFRYVLIEHNLLRSVYLHVVEAERGSFALQLKHRSGFKTVLLSDATVIYTRGIRLVLEYFQIIRHFNIILPLNVGDVYDPAALILGGQTLALQYIALNYVQVTFGAKSDQ
jgi:hypothetical protein